MPVYLLNLFLCFAILALNILYGDYVNYPPEMIHFCILLFGCYFLCNNLLFFLIYRVTKKEAQLQQQLHDQEQLAVYTKELEKINQSFRSFKHDYMNILLTMDEYLKTRQYDALTSYFRKQILPAGCGLNEVHAQTSVLSNLQIPEIKGLLIGKCNYAISKNLRLQLTIPFQPMLRLSTSLPWPAYLESSWITPLKARNVPKSQNWKYTGTLTKQKP